MYLVVEPLTRFLVFTDEDPRDDGYDGLVEQDVTLDEPGTLLARSEDSTAAVPCLGKSSDDEKLYRVFECTKDCRQAGFESVGTVYAKYHRWSEFEEDS